MANKRQLYSHHEYFSSMCKTYTFVMLIGRSLFCGPPGPFYFLAFRSTFNARLYITTSTHTMRWPSIHTIVLHFCYTALKTSHPFPIEESLHKTKKCSCCSFFFSRGSPRHSYNLHCRSVFWCDEMHTNLSMLAPRPLNVINSHWMHFAVPTPNDQPPVRPIFLGSNSARTTKKNWSFFLKCSGVWTTFLDGIGWSDLTLVD